MATVNARRINFRASPTGHRFHMSDARVRAIVGPVGSGKSSEIIFGEVFKRGSEQEADHMGVRKTRVAMVRNTYQQLESTTLKTFQDWWGHDICTYKNGKTMEAHIRMPLPDGTKADIEVVFLALDKPEDIGKIRSLELTMAYINEASEIGDYTICDALNERIGRYPKQWGTDEKPEGGCTWCGIVMDSNAPDDEHWLYHKFEVEKPDGFEIFHQPPAVLMGEGGTPENPMWEANKGQRPGIPAAENIEHLGRAGHGWDYYMNMLPGKDYEVVRVMLQGYYGTVAYGKKVYPEWNDQVYYLPNRKDAKSGRTLDVEPMRGLPVLLGIDFGIQWSAAVFAQLSPVRQLRVLEELVLQDVSTQEFATRVKGHLQTHYYGMKVHAFGDPCAKARDRQTGITDIVLLNQYGIPTLAGPTNDPKKRRDAVAYFMQRLVGDGQPGLVLGSKCQMLRKGFNGRYYYKRVSASAREQMYKADPVKNEFSHPHDALQYIATSLLYEPGQADAATQSSFGVGQFAIGGGNFRKPVRQEINLGGFC